MQQLKRAGSWTWETKRIIDMILHLNQVTTGILKCQDLKKSVKMICSALNAGCRTAMNITGDAYGSRRNRNGFIGNSITRKINKVWMNIIINTEKKIGNSAEFIPETGREKKEEVSDSTNSMNMKDAVYAGICLTRTIRIMQKINIKNVITGSIKGGRYNLSKTGKRRFE